MQTLVIYDIPDDRVRNRLAEVCKDYGLERIQWSAFLGDLNQNRRRELLLRMQRTLGRHNGNIRAFPICDKDLRLAFEIRVESPDAEKQELEERDTSGRRTGASITIYRIKGGRR